MNRCLLVLALLANPAAAESLALRHVNIVDAGAKGTDMTVVVEGDRIAAIAEGGAPLPAGARVVDLRGQFLIPGLWDMHVHLSFAGEHALLDFLAAGVTGVRDMGGDVWQVDAWRREIAEGARIGPTIVQAGPMLDGPKPGLPHRITVETADDGRAATAVLKRGLHVDFVKVHDGVPRDAFLAIAAEAKKQGLPLACHLPSAVTVEEASSAGCASIEHIAESIVTSLYLQQAAQDRSFDRVLDDLSGSRGKQLFALFVKNGTWVDPTLTAFDRFAQTSDTGARVQTREAAHVRLVKIVGLMHRAGVKMLAGSDTAGSFWPTDIHDELRLLVQAGLPPAEALSVATRGAAAFLKTPSDRGAIEVGNVANLVLLRADPLEDIRNSRGIAAVVARGRYFTAEQLQRLVASSRAR
jgi:imidazolonepropionase-like amidohydrolase